MNRVQGRKTHLNEICKVVVFSNCDWRRKNSSSKWEIMFTHHSWEGCSKIYLSKWSKGSFDQVLIDRSRLGMSVWNVPPNTKHPQNKPRFTAFVELLELILFVSGCNRLSCTVAREWLVEVDENRERWILDIIFVSNLRVFSLLFCDQDTTTTNKKREAD